MIVVAQIDSVVRIGLIPARPVRTVGILVEAIVAETVITVLSKSTVAVRKLLVLLVGIPSGKFRRTMA